MSAGARLVTYPAPPSWSIASPLTGRCLSGPAAEQVRAPGGGRRSPPASPRGRGSGPRLAGPRRCQAGGHPAPSGSPTGPPTASAWPRGGPPHDAPAQASGLLRQLEELRGELRVEGELPVGLRPAGPHVLVDEE